MNYEELAKQFLMKMMNRFGQMKFPDQDFFQGEAIVLWCVQHYKETTPKDIAEKICVSSARVAAVLNGLEEKGFVTREIDSVDRRRIIVKLTSQGEETIKCKMSEVLARTAQALEKLGEHDAREYVRITEKLTKLIML